MKLDLLETPRLTLRPFRDGDLPLMRLLDSDPEVTRFLGHGEVKSEEESAKNLAKIQNDYEEHGLGLFAIFGKGGFLGRGGLIPWRFGDAVTWEVGYTLRREAWGQGYATEAALALAGWARENLPVSHVISLIHPQNRSSIRVAEKAGMRFYGTRQIDSRELAVYRADFGAR